MLPDRGRCWCPAQPLRGSPRESVVAHAGMRWIPPPSGSRWHLHERLRLVREGQHESPTLGAALGAKLRDGAQADQQLRLRQEDTAFEPNAEHLILRDVELGIEQRPFVTRYLELSVVDEAEVRDLRDGRAFNLLVEGLACAALECQHVPGPQVA